jgi:hypothetical protein
MLDNRTVTRYHGGVEADSRLAGGGASPKTRDCVSSNNHTTHTHGSHGPTLGRGCRSICSSDSRGHPGGERD